MAWQVKRFTVLIRLYVLGKADSTDLNNEVNLQIMKTKRRKNIF